MKIDLSQFNDIDFDNIGAWPRLVKVVFSVFLALTVFGGSYLFFISDALDSLAAEQAQELQLKTDFASKYQLAANLPLYRQQLTEMESQFAELLKMLPSENEMPGLLDDITFVATDAGLGISSLNWEAEVERDFYLEFPINMSVTGSYHQLGKLVDGVAKLPRIVSLHDFSIGKQANGQLVMDIQAKTYRFKDDAEWDHDKEAK
ncbi:pilus assembly protein PilO [Shewanella sp. NFH-SH190041]|uniref:type 4a pilus biogenesis protein PilO n=1 Tax=Shewanella sp. NFH-SH190041 TaxID=2950245 RepID=UPI0021C2892D|nr:type 4a pilus biogenesis protein PilO [Shewanella sp. NFH-SH190041]BDM65920.1 pilus assembly protein PilO [Shewanella sp. NFH-SH190041]